jgi:hypothetical protein
MTPASVQCLTRPTNTSPTKGRNTSRRNVTATPQQTRDTDNQCDGWTCLRANYLTLHHPHSRYWVRKSASLPLSSARILLPLKASGFNETCGRTPVV